MTLPGKGQSPLRRFGKVVVQVGLTVAITWFILKAVGFSLEELWQYDLSGIHPRWGLLFLSSAILLGAYLYSAALWGLMVREIGLHEVGLLPALRVFFTANLGRYLPGKVWQIAGLALLAKGEGVPPATATAAAILGQAFSIAGATLVGAGVLLESGWGGRIGAEWAGVLLLLILLLSTVPAVLRALLGLWFRLARQSAPGGFRPDTAFGVRWMGLYALGWVFQGLAFWVLVRALGFDLNLMQAAPAYSAAYVLGYLILVAPAGAGIREGMLVVFLGTPLGAGAAVAAIVARLWTTVVELVPAVLLGSRYLKSNKREEADVV